MLRQQALATMMTDGTSLELKEKSKVLRKKKLVLQSPLRRHLIGRASLSWIMAVFLYTLASDSRMCCSATPDNEGNENTSKKEVGDLHNHPHLHDLKCYRQLSSDINRADSLKCEFVVSNYGERATEMLSKNGEQALEEYCDENNLLCMQARLLTIGDASSTETAQHDPSSVKSEKSNSAETLAKSATQGQTTASTLQHPSSSLLRQLYEPPYSQYGEEVEASLKEWLISEAMFQNVPGGASAMDVNDDMYVVAEWMHRIGMAHRNEATKISSRQGQQQENEQALNNNSNENSFHKQVQWSIRSFRKALQHYEGLAVDTDTGDPLFRVLKQLHMAICCYNLAESLTLSNDPKQAELDKDYYVQADQLFSNCKTHLMELPPSSASSQTSFPLFFFEGVETGNQRSLDSLWKDALTAWGQVSVRLGVAEMSSSDSAFDLLDLPLSGDFSEDDIADLQTMTMNLLQTGGDMADLDLSKGGEELQQALSDLVKNKLPKFLASSERAESYFEHAASLFRRILTKHPGEDDYVIQIQLGNALQNLGTTSISKGDSETGIRRLEETLEIQQTALTNIPSNPNERDGFDDNDLKQAIGETLYSLAQSYLDKGDYDSSHTMYNRAMEWFGKHELDPVEVEASVSVTGDGIGVEGYDETYAQSIQEFERALEEYQEMFSAGGVGVNNDNFDDSGAYYQQDDGYEADLHNGLGALYMATGDLMEAMVHITQAVQLYSRSGEQGERHFADLKLSQALLFFRQGQFQESASAHNEALQMYRKMSGDGESPFKESGILDLQSLMKEAQRAADDQFTQDTTSNQAADENNDSGTHKDEIEVTADGTDRLRMNIRPLIVPEGSFNETEMDVTVPVVGAE